MKVKVKKNATSMLFAGRRISVQWRKAGRPSCNAVLVEGEPPAQRGRSQEESAPAPKGRAVVPEMGKNGDPPKNRATSASAQRTGAWLGHVIFSLSQLLKVWPEKIDGPVLLALKQSHGTSEGMGHFSNSSRATIKRGENF